MSTATFGAYGMSGYGDQPYGGPSTPTGTLSLEVGPADPAGSAIDLLGASYSLTVRRGNSARGVTDTIEAGTLAAVIDGPAANPLDHPSIRTGAEVRVLCYATAPGEGLDWRPIYTGRIDRARLVYTGGPGKADPTAYRVTLTATDAAPVLAAAPAEGAVSGTLPQRVAHALAGAGVPYEVTDPSPPTTSSALPSNERTAAGALRLAVDTDHAVAYIDRTNAVRVIADAARPRRAEALAGDYTATDTAGGPDADLHYYALSPALDTDALVNVLEVEHLATGTTTHVDDASRTEWGPHADKVTVNDGLPETHADLWLASRRDPALRPESLSLNVFARPSHLEAAVNLEPYATITVARDGVLATPVTSYVRDLEHHITASRRDGVQWLLHLGLRPREVLATRWDDVPPDLTWDDVPPDLTWDDAVNWHPYL